MSTNENIKDAGSNFNSMKSVRGRSLRDRFEEKVARSSGCWEWIGSRVRAGYGQLMVDGRPHRAHRVSYELNVGPIPAGMFVCHRCDNPSCVRPSHLFLGTPADNIRDCKTKGRLNNEAKGLKGSKNPFAKLTESEVVRIRALARSRNTFANIARQFSVSEKTVSGICHGKRWSHV